MKPWNSFLWRSLLFPFLLLGSCTDNSTEPQLTPPTADFSITPPSGWTGTMFQFDASASRTFTGPDSTLEVRWDWEDDGTWDTAWSTNRTTIYSYDTEGTWTIRLEVRDSAGMTDQTSIPLVVGLNLAPETLITGVSWPNPFTPHITWSGSDPDGTISAYRIGWDGPMDSQLVFTADSLFQFVTPGPRRFSVAAVDDRGRPDPTPATLEMKLPFIDGPAAFVQVLGNAYTRRDWDAFIRLLANDPEKAAEYLFLLSEPTPENETQWGYFEEVRIHQRMFHPETPLPGETPVPPEIWLQSVTITLRPLGPFTVRPDLYTPGGYLDPLQWKASEARYATYGLFDMAGDTDYRVEGEASFVVIEDLTKNLHEPGKFLLLIWEDLGVPFDAAVQEATWSNLKSLYR